MGAKNKFDKFKPESEAHFIEELKSHIKDPNRHYIDQYIFEAIEAINLGKMHIEIPEYYLKDSKDGFISFNESDFILKD